MAGTKAHQRYRNAKGIVVPGVTTILGLLNKPALVYWAWNLGMHGEDYHKVSERAATVGTITHYLVECFLKGIKPDLKEYSPANVERAQVAFKEFEDWWYYQELTLQGSEIQLVSEEMQCGGTLDCVAHLGLTGDLWLVDIKTSKAVYDEMLYQLAAYSAIWDECYPNQPIASAHIIQLSKEDGRLSHHTYKDLSKELEIFKALRHIYALRKQRDPNRNDQRRFKIKGGD